MVIKSLTANHECIDLWLAFDIHYAHEEQDQESYFAYLEWLADTPNAYMINGGDWCEWATPTSNKYKYILTQTESPELQWLHVKSVVEHNQKKLLAFIIGNHEAGRIVNSGAALYDPFDALCRKHKIFYSRRNTHFILRLQEKKYAPYLPYIFYLSHGSSGAQNPQHPPAKIIRDGICAMKTDFIVVGHTHHNDKKPYRRLMLDKKYQPFTHTTWGLRPGSFLTNPEYISMGFPRAEVPGNMILRLFTKRKGFMIFDNLEQLRRFDE